MHNINICPFCDRYSLFFFQCELTVIQIANFTLIHMYFKKEFLRKYSLPRDKEGSPITRSLPVMQYCGSAAIDLSSHRRRIDGIAKRMRGT